MQEEDRIIRKESIFLKDRVGGRDVSRVSLCACRLAQLLYNRWHLPTHHLTHLHPTHTGTHTPLHRTHILYIHCIIVPSLTHTHTCLRPLIHNTFTHIQICTNPHTHIYTHTLTHIHMHMCTHLAPHTHTASDEGIPHSTDILRDAGGWVLVGLYPCCQNDAEHQHYGQENRWAIIVYLRLTEKVSVFNIGRKDWP